MKSIHIIISFLITLITLISCEKVIDVELEDSEPKIVIEAVLEEGENEFEVKISKTAPYFESSPAEVIETAIVTLSFENNTIEIPNTGNGSYKTIISAVPNSEYRLDVIIDEVFYTAYSYLPESIPIDSAYAIYETGFGPKETGYTVYVIYSDPIGTNNYYRLTHSLNGDFQNLAADLRVLNDNNNDGSQPRIPLSFNAFEEGDIIDINLIHFDEASYDYFSSLGDIIGSNNGPNSGSAAPGNPISNWSNYALGYFSAYSKSSTRLVIN